MIQIILVNDNNIVRNEIEILLKSVLDITILGQANNAEEALNLITKNNRIDVVLTTIDDGELNGTTLIKEIKALNHHVKIISISKLDNQQQIIKTFNDGASGYLLQNISKDELSFAIKQVNKGEKYLSNEIGFKLLNNVVQQTNSTYAGTKQLVDFTSREIEVLNLVAEGYTNNEIADRLFLSKRTIEGHRQALIDKTGMKNTAALIRFALVNRLIQ
ncbi:response regulator transcription factor [Pedobacter nototheniae]|uniref:response regulator transcription factor n=1 Tax=Pedobacter nototheniae TaxID=2488994 RepID=UPI00103BD546|nr:response regulator transcription factor [Pedobacter nototheniae]